MMIALWLAAIVVFGVVEVLTTGLCAVWFVFGAVAALIGALLHGSLAVQLTLFIAATLVTLLLTRPLAKKMSAKEKVFTNLDHVIGQTVAVTGKSAGSGALGSVYVDGKTWSAVSADGSPLAVGEMVQILRIEGVRLLVQKSKISEEVK